MSITRIGVWPAEAYRVHQYLLRTVGELYGVSFVADTGTASESFDAALIFAASGAEAMARSRFSPRSLAFLAESARDGIVGSGVRFTTTSRISRCFRGAVVEDRSLVGVAGLRPATNDEVVAQQGDVVLWLYRREGEGGVDLVAVDPPTLSDGDYLFQYFQKKSWFSLLPLLHFVREISGVRLPPPRACFMLDDPNLHWRSYGYVRYRELVESANRHNFHIAFATVPLDAWYVHTQTARLFVENAQRLSLLVHGNNHTSLELLRVTGKPSQEALARQALRRVERLEHRAGVSVSRVIAAPHGACSHEMAGVLRAAGFEAACISRGSLMSRNPNSSWPSSFGLRPAEFLGPGLPVIPRFAISANLDANVRLAAFLGQPVIPMGHHYDLRNGLELLEETAGLINSLGDVQWTSAETMARTNFGRRRSGDTMTVDLYSRRIRFFVPGGVSWINVNRPWIRPSRTEPLSLRQLSTVSHAAGAGQSEVFPVVGGSVATVDAMAPPQLASPEVAVARTSIHAIVRRQLCEGRDRLLPLVGRLVSGFGAE